MDELTIPTPARVLEAAREYGAYAETTQNGRIIRAQIQRRLESEGRWGTVKTSGARCFAAYVKQAEEELSESDLWALVFMAYPPFRNDEDVCRCGRTASDHLVSGCQPIEQERQDGKSRTIVPTVRNADEPDPSIVPAYIADVPEVTDGAQGATVDMSMRDTIGWVLDNLKVKVTPQQAPTPRAWSLLLYAREHPNVVSQWTTRLMSAEEAHYDPMEDDGRETIELLEKLKKAYPLPEDENGNGT